MEIIETSGCWLGLNDNIGTMLTDASFNVYPEDVILLYTDGIVESRQKASGNKNTQLITMFDLPNLIAVFKSLGNLPVEAIRDGIIGELQAKYITTDDDVSLVVIKRLG